MCQANQWNETVSLGDTAISLHTLQLQFWDSWEVKTQSAKFWPSFHFWGEGVFLGNQNSECQALTKFSIGGGDKISKNFAMPYSGSPCIADVETNYMYLCFCRLFLTE